MNKRRIALLILSLALVIACLLSTASCMYAIDILTGEEQTGEQSNNSSTENGKNPTTPSNGTGTGSQDSNEENNEPVFHPDAETDGESNVRPEIKPFLSTVAIVTKFDILSAYPYYEDTTEYTSFSSGVIYELDKEKGNALVITNYHAVYNKGEVATGGFSDGISLYLYGMENEQYAIPATVIGGSMNYDIAVLRVSGSEILKNSMATAAELGSSEAVQLLDEVHVVGYPEGLGISVTEGSVSVVSESLVMTGADGRTTISLRVIRTSAAVNEGNSGGGFYSADGKLIGIICAKRTGAEVDNIGYAIPIDLAVKVANNILRNCDGGENLSVKKCTVGVGLGVAASGLVTDEEGNIIIVERVGIVSIEENCITTELKVGDVITAIEIDGVKTPVTRTYHVTDTMLDASAGSTAVFTIDRGGETVTVTVTLPESCVTTVK